MKIRLEIPNIEELPSQGRNRGSIPRGSATGTAPAEKTLSPYEDGDCPLQPQDDCLVTVEPYETDAIPAVFVGWTRDCNRLVFDLGESLLAVAPEDIEVLR